MSTARTPVSWQMAISRAFTPVVSALVSSVMLPMPISWAARVAPVDLGVALERRHEAEADRLDDRVDEIRHAPALQRLDAAVERIEALAEVGDHDDARAAARAARGPPRRLEPLTLSTISAPASTAVRISAGSKLSMLTRMPAPRSSRTTAPKRGEGDARAYSRCR